MTCFHSTQRESGMFNICTIISTPAQVRKADKMIMQTYKPRDIPIGVNINSSPVEVKGYKNIINLPDWRDKPKKLKKLRKPSFFPFFNRNSPCSETLLNRSTKHSRWGLVLSDNIKWKRGRSPKTGDLKNRTRYREKYTFCQMPAYEHTVIGTGIREQKTTWKNAYKPYIGLWKYLLHQILELNGTIHDLCIFFVQLYS